MTRHASSSNAQARPTPLRALILRLHFYIGLFIAPFMLVAAISGTLYALTPQLEAFIYHDELTATRQGTPKPLDQQIERAQRALGTTELPVAVRPAPEPGTTTRIMFNDASLGEYEHRAVFVDPVTLEIKGSLPAYGTSGTLALRITLDKFHRALLLGDTGRLYSELAASWLWIAALGGLALWLTRPSRAATSPETRRTTLNRWHRWLGGALMLGLLFFSATGLTWSKWAGGNIAELRHTFGWATPSVSLALSGSAPEHGHQHHSTMTHDEMASGTPATFARLMAQARAAGLDSGHLEIQAKPAGTAWKVREIDRRWPTNVDEAAFDPTTGRLVDLVRFEQYPLAAKLTRWGIDAHMGILFGWLNQLILATVGLGLATMIVLGYRMWWLRRVRAVQAQHGARTLITLWRALSIKARLVTAAALAVFGWILPVLGVSAVIMLILDALIVGRARSETDTASG
ncbi:PepSY-associated TM helix domain-containing protein [Larsenimonas suaedae]|uniref:PepSY-associated TM helix domain-containing protein n=1 Tax=Larsenimonas suaedae TaxID=1851019 RepID=A0ABU1GWC4_9GAMM|nr:PepSY-associated TM helix domain-containing protein [Larsenimonas suaedae]MCM2972926.1 PepSY domain-containing protein [Larsenimonas suaedae]MDR5896363.1 PepSY-associated TM helix domain-containing protein [Larsenimonas suaedae]